MADKVNKSVFKQVENNSGKNKDIDDCFNKALKYSLLLLKYRARTKKDICQRLKEKGWDNLLVTKVVNYLEEKKYLNDKKFVELFIENSLDKGWGQRRVCFYLKKNGVAFDFTKDINKLNDVFLKGLRKNIIKKISAYSDQNDEIGKKKFLGRVARSMVAKGFNHEDVFREINSLEEGYFEDK